MAVPWSDKDGCNLLVWRRRRLSVRLEVSLEASEKDNDWESVVLARVRASKRYTRISNIMDSSFFFFLDKWN